MASIKNFCAPNSVGSESATATAIARLVSAFLPLSAVPPFHGSLLYLLPSKSFADSSDVVARIWICLCCLSALWYCLLPHSPAPCLPHGASCPLFFAASSLYSYVEDLPLAALITINIACNRKRFCKCFGLAFLFASSCRVYEYPNRLYPALCCLKVDAALLCSHLS